jgi:hypothetical protein
VDLPPAETNIKVSLKFCCFETQTGSCLAEQRFDIPILISMPPELEDRRSNFDGNRLKETV